MSVILLSAIFAHGQCGLQYVLNHNTVAVLALSVFQRLCDIAAALKVRHHIVVRLTVYVYCIPKHVPMIAVTMRALIKYVRVICFVPL